MNGIVVHIKMMFWMCLIFILCEWYCLIYIRSKSKGEIYLFELWHTNNMQTFIATSSLILFLMFWLLFGRFSLLVSMSHFSSQFQRITHIHTYMCNIIYYIQTIKKRRLFYIVYSLFPVALIHGMIEYCPIPWVIWFTAVLHAWHGCPNWLVCASAYDFLRHYCLNF